MYSSQYEEEKINYEHISNLYYGYNQCFFKECNGSTFTFNDQKHTFKAKSDSESIKTVKQRRKPQINLGSEYSNLLLPSMPCHDIQIIDYAEKQEHKPKGLISAAPLIKCKSTDYSIKKDIIGYKSGIRSALIKIDDEEDLKHTDNKNNKNEKQDSIISHDHVRWYRLKGCGNNDLGYFPFQCIEDGQSPLIEIRGCCFEHTANRELKMTYDIQKILNKYNLATANQSYGSYNYDIDKYCKKIIRTCSIFKTLGNKRFGDHLILGLLKILPLIIDIENTNILSIYNLFPKIRRQHEINNDETKWKVMQSYLAVLCELDIINLKNKNDDDIKIPLNTKLNENESDLEWLLGGDNDFKYKQSLWNYQCEAYNDIISKCDKQDINRLIIDIYYRLGFESGFIQKLLHNDNISWGTYNDSLGTHCNAHANNYVILPYNEFIKYNFCLAPLDFDMAFYENEYIQDMEQENKQKGYTFKELITMECNGNRGSLSGDPDISTGVHWNEDNMNKYKYKDNEQKNKFELINWALRDTLISSFDDAYNIKYDHDEIKTKFKWNENKQKLMYAIFNLALIATIDVVA